MSKVVTQEQLEQLVENLKNTMSSIEREAEQLGFEYEDLTDEQFEYIDSEIFCCEECGWWCPFSELSLDASNAADFICMDCACDPDEDEDLDDEETDFD